jgi:cytoskeletal protein RodZ
MGGSLPPPMGERSAADFGSRLRAARERRGVELRHIAAKTKIPAAVLEALERNDVSRLPGGIFSRAFVRSYATEVGLDPERTIRDFIDAFPQESAAAHAPAGAIEDNEAVESDRQMATTFLRLVLISAPLAAIVLYFSTVGRHPGGGDIPPAAAAAPATTIAPATMPAASAAHPIEPAAPAPTAPAPVSGATAASTPRPVSVPTSGSQPAAAVPAGGDAPAPAGDLLVVGLSVKRACWVSATVDGQQAIDRLVQPGDAQTLEVHRELMLTAGDGAAVVLTLNGADARAIGRSGEVATARLTPTNFSAYLANR